MAVAVVFALSLNARAADDDALTIADLPRLRAAISAQSTTESPQPATFRDLWDRPDQFRDARVQVRGRVVTLFHKPAVGQFPALVEAWLFDPTSDPFCLVFPESADKSPRLGETVDFTGTFLRKIRYKSGDVDRLAPLIVGGTPPQRLDVTAQPPAEKSPWDGVVLAIVGLIIVSALLRVGLRRPIRRPIVEDPPPIFDDAPVDESGESHG